MMGLVAAVLWLRSREKAQRDASAWKAMATRPVTITSTSSSSYTVEDGSWLFRVRRT